MTSEQPTLGADDLYDANYYASNLGMAYERNDHWLRFFGEIADRITSELRPQSVLDVGCAFGFLVEALRDRNVDAQGIDISSYAIGQAAGSAVGHCRVRSATEPFDGQYDLVVSIEMVEHMSPPAGRQALANMAAVTDRILLSTTPFDHTEATHLNVRPSEYWAAIMESLGFFRDLNYDASYLTEWATLYVRRQPSIRDLVIDYERSDSLIRIERNQLRKEVLRLDSVLGGVRTEVGAFRRELEAMETDRNRLNTELAEVNRKMQDVAGDLAKLREEADASKRDAGATRERLEGIEGSRSWRLMWAVMTPWRWLRKIAASRNSPGPSTS